MLKKVLSAVLCFALLFITFAASAYGISEAKSNGDFSDVQKDHWAYSAIRWMIENNIVEGTGDGKFSPQREVTRDEFAKMMVLALDLELINPSKGSFLDINKGGWQYKYVETAKFYLTGFKTASGDYFHPSQSAVREDMAVALVKALGFSNETADLDLLSQFSDAGEISPNLKKFVAIAVKHELMQGYDRNGSRVFAPAEGLNRASAAVLLYNALHGNEEKITYDEEKVTYDNRNDADDPDEGDDDDKDDNKYSNDLKQSRIKVTKSDDSLLLSWDKITSSDFSGYKVVISKSDPTPVYPDNGYLRYITDRNDTSIIVRGGDDYNGGDVGGRLKSGTEYYFSITVLYNNGKTAGNVVRAKLP
jgi:hypothetical protein